jgi:acetyl-CoA carboxylase biotin carboxyl carrier protein
VSRPEDSLDAAQAVEAVLGLVGGTRIADIEVAWDGGRVRVKREPTVGVTQTTEDELQPVTSDEIVVGSLFVGIFHQEPASAFPRIGDTVRTGQVIAHVETLRVQNAVLAPADGAILEVLVADGTPVEYGQPLVMIRQQARSDGDEAAQ